MESVIAKVRLKKESDVYLWIIDKCPFCGKRHCHGGGSLDGDPRRLLGGRVPHCDHHQGLSYTLVEIDQK